MCLCMYACVHICFCVNVSVHNYIYKPVIHMIVLRDTQVTSALLHVFCHANVAQKRM